MPLSIDVNTILTSLTLGCIVWLLRSQTSNTTAVALAAQRHEHTEREMVELRTRVAIAEATIAEVSLKVARLEGGANSHAG
jgi:hypothetical protein